MKIMVIKNIFEKKMLLFLSCEQSKFSVTPSWTVLLGECFFIIIIKYQFGNIVGDTNFSELVFYF